MGPDEEQVAYARPRIEIDCVLKETGGVDVAGRVEGQVFPEVEARAAPTSCPEQTARSVQLGDEHVGEAGGGEVGDPQAGIEVGGVCVSADDMDVAGAVHRDAEALIEPAPSERLSPDEGARGAQLGHENIECASQVGHAGPRVEVCGAVEVAGRVDVACAVDCDAQAEVLARPAHPLCPQEVAGRVQLGDEHVLGAGRHQVEHPGAGVEVGGIAEEAGRVDVACAVDCDGGPAVGTRTSEGFGPDKGLRMGCYRHEGDQ